MPHDDTTASALSGDLEVVAKHAAALAVSDAEELMEAVTRESIRMLREELRGEIQEVMACMERLESAHEENKPPQVVAPKDLELVKDKVSAMGYEVHTLQAKLSQHQVAQCKNANKEHVDMQIADLQTSLAQVRGESMRDQLLEMKAQMQELNAEVSGRSVQPDSVSRSDLESIRESAMSALRAQEAASKEHVDRQIADLHALLLQTKGDIAQHAPKERDDKQIADLQTSLAQVRDESMQDQLLEIKAQMQELNAEVSGHSVQPDSVSRSDLEAIRESAMSALRAQEAASREHVYTHMLQLRTDLSQMKDEQSSALRELRGAATKDHVNKQISDLHVRLSTIKNETANENLSGIRRQMQEMQVNLSELKNIMRSQMQRMQKKLSERTGHSELENRSDVEAIKHVDQKISDVQAHLSKIKSEQEATASELRGHSEATKENVNKQISDLHSHLSEIKKHLAQHIDKSDVVLRAELEEIQDNLVCETSSLQGQFKEFREKSDVIYPKSQQELNALNDHVADTCKKSGHMQAEVELREVQRDMNMRFNELREVVDKLVKGSSKEEWLGKVARLEHDIEELRSEAISLRITVNSEQQRASQAQGKLEERVFCKFFQASI